MSAFDDLEHARRTIVVQDCSEHDDTAYGAVAEPASLFVPSADYSGDEVIRRISRWCQANHPADRSQINDGFHSFGELYRERSALTAALARQAQWQEKQVGVAPGTFAWVGRDASEGFDGFRTVLYLNLPTGQVSWHFSDEDATEFLAGIYRPSGFEQTRPGNRFTYDGHDTSEKHRRVEVFARTEVTT
jgi:hypothetical protein